MVAPAVDGDVGVDVAGYCVDDADAVASVLEAAGLPPPRVSRVAGHADRVPVVANPGALRNDRVEIILLIDR